MNIEYVTRQMVEEDKSFIFNSFLQSYHQNSPVKFCPKTIYFKQQSAIIQYLLDHANILIACYPEDATAIMGYAIYQEVAGMTVLHYVYTKNAVRRQGVASSLLNSIIGDRHTVLMTHVISEDHINPDDPLARIAASRRRSFFALKNKLKAKCVYDPFLITTLRLQEEQ